MMARIAEELGVSPDRFRKRAQRILEAVQERLWLPSKGVVAEYVDTIGNKLVHPSPELATAYLAIDCGLVDMFQAYRMLRFTETDIRNERTLGRGGRLAYSSNWLPKKYSTCGLFPAENAHLALVYFQLGLKAKGIELLDALTEAYFSGHSPGMARHILSGSHLEGEGDMDFSDVSSTYLRLLVEGLCGIRFRLIEGTIEIAPGFPDHWTQAHLGLPDLALDYRRAGPDECFTVHTDRDTRKVFKIPLRATRLESVWLNGVPVTDYRIEPAVGACFLVVGTDSTGRIELRVAHGATPLPELAGMPESVLQNGEIALRASAGEIIEFRDGAGAFSAVSVHGAELRATAGGATGHQTLFVRVKADEYDAWLAKDCRIEERIPAPTIAVPRESRVGRFEPVDISACFNAATGDLHTREYRSPRPGGYSIGVRLNGRYAWEWNHCGHNAVVIDDSGLRGAGGTFTSPSGIPFLTPPSGPNLACASVWDNFPTTLRIPIGRKACELAVFFIGVTNAMQSHVENARFTLEYVDGHKESLSLVHPVSFDDWLVAALQTTGETVYFSHCNHGTVQRLRLDPNRELGALAVEAVANEVIVGVLGVSVATR